MYIFISVNMYATRRCTHGVPTVYPYPQYPWLTEPEGMRVRVLTGTGMGQPGPCVTNVRSQVICHATPSWDRFYLFYLSSILTITYLLTRSIAAIYDSTVLPSISLILRVYLSFFPFLFYISLLYKP